MSFYFNNFSQTPIPFQKTTINNFYNYIAINSCKMWISNKGYTYNPGKDEYGLQWPGGEKANKTLIAEDGLVWGGIVNDKIRINGDGGLQPGKILFNGNPDDSSLKKYRVYKLNKDWEQIPEGPIRVSYGNDFLEWPVEDGAPWIDINKDGKYTIGQDKPDFLGDEMLWYVSNDFDSLYSWWSSKPIGLEIQTTVFAFNKLDYFADIIYKKYKIVNKSKQYVKDMYFGYWAYLNIGDGRDDYCGCDTTLNLGYGYNSDGNDIEYGNTPPAVGFEFINVTPKTANSKFMSSFAPFVNNTVFPEPMYPDEYYNCLQGNKANGSDYRDPHTGKTTKFPLAGDPVNHIGWYEGNGWPNPPKPGFRKIIMTTDAYNIAPNDTIEIVIAIIVGSGSDNLNSVTNLKKKAAVAKTLYDMNFKTAQPPPSPILHTYSMDRSFKLWWEDNAENYDERDPFLPIDNKIDSTYTFEGYRLWQYEDKNGNNPKLLDVYDIKNNIDVINDMIMVNGKYFLAPVIVGNNKGLKREITISIDYFHNYLALNNYSPYYFGVTAYAYNENSTPSYLESPHKVIEVIPGQKLIDVTYPYTVDDAVIASQIVGNSDACIKFNIIDPTALTGDLYQVILNGNDKNLSYNLFNKTKNDTLLKNQKEFTAEITGKKIIDGFILSVQNLGKDSIAAANTKYRMKSILEIKGPGGTTLTQPIDVINNLSSSSKWIIKIKGANKRLNWQVNPADEGLGYDDYEIRFDGTSKYYPSGYAHSFNPILKSDTLSVDTLPFEAWCIGRDPNTTDDDYRLAIKVLDYDRQDSSRTIPDDKWTQLDNNDWEELFAYKPNFDPADPPQLAGISKFPDHKFGSLSISGSVPDPGTVIRIVTFKPITGGDIFEAKLTSANLNDKEAAKKALDEIGVFPNPYFGINDFGGNMNQDFVRFINLPKAITIRIYDLAGAFIKKIEKNNYTQYLDWDLTNFDGTRVSSGMYIAMLTMDGIGNKVLKIALVMGKKYIDR
ncbi:MAG: T9SS type A sorting domain-containing protein [Ignavibacteriales bacterium]|nr:T9SS type A sorting domain-containing protein [Ignavibacteriales bacterium]